MWWPYSHEDGVPVLSVHGNSVAHTDTELQFRGVIFVFLSIFALLINPFYHINDNLENFSLYTIPALLINIIALIISWTALACVVYYFLILPFLDSSDLCDDGFQSLILERKTNYTNLFYNAFKEEHTKSALDITYNKNTNIFIFDKPDDDLVFGDRDYVPLQFIINENVCTVYNNVDFVVGTITFEDNDRQPP